MDITNLPRIETLPDLFLMNDGSTVKTKQDWEKRREELKKALFEYGFGQLPPAPGECATELLSTETVCNGAATERRLRLSMGPGHSIHVRVSLITPVGSGPYPVILRNVNGLGEVPLADEIVRRGYMVAEYIRNDLDPDEKDTIGPAQAAYPEYDWSTLAVWAWGGSRIIDYLITLDEVDSSRIAVTGHSRDGKAALLLGALDKRVALTVPNGSGAGGAGCFRILGEKSETLKIITTNFPHWFHPKLNLFSDKETHLPFDLHFLKALVAPRGLLSTDSTDDRWANPYGTQQTYLAAKRAYDFLGVPARIGIHFRTGQHDHLPEDWRVLMDFADRLFHGKKIARQFDRLPFPVDERTAPADESAHSKRKDAK